ncbi:MAG: nicotinate-nucleotide--dimethylbenzimidazole phosphoribosyltransferase [Butyrivibrio sp.]|nr:nicotinate-nucleotide--dimethylbenzimidazole phosphoribosyltransferase [Butyrivibrio sp.]
MSDYRNTYSRQEIFSLKVNAPDHKIYDSIRKRWDGISKPIDGLGNFEKVICRIGAIQKKELPTFDNRYIVIMCSDNGIVDEGVSQTGREVTYQVARMLGQGTSTANTLAKKAAAKVMAVDMGIDCPEKIPGVIPLKVDRGTKDYLKEDAMTEEQVLMAIGSGIDVAKTLKDEDADIVVSGEMGIGNTTTAATLLSLLVGDDGSSFVGRGAGLDDKGLLRKKEVILDAVTKYGDGKFSLDDKDKVFKYLCEVGGFDIAGLCGLFIGCGLYEIPVVIDGLITAVAALLARCFVPGTREYMIAAHKGREKGLIRALDLLDLEPFIEGNMALGEGTGGIMLLPLIDMALDFYKSASTFDAGGIREYTRFS